MEKNVIVTDGVSEQNLCFIVYSEFLKRRKGTLVFQTHDLSVGNYSQKSKFSSVDQGSMKE